MWQEAETGQKERGVAAESIASYRRISSIADGEALIRS